jgi:hypothetical protein
VVPKKSKTSSSRDVKAAGIILWHKSADKKDTKKEMNEGDMAFTGIPSSRPPF